MLPPLLVRLVIVGGAVRGCVEATGSVGDEHFRVTTPDGILEPAQLIGCGIVQRCLYQRRAIIGCQPLLVAASEGLGHALRTHACVSGVGFCQMLSQDAGRRQLPHLLHGSAEDQVQLARGVTSQGADLLASAGHQPQPLLREPDGCHQQQRDDGHSGRTQDESAAQFHRSGSVRRKSLTFRIPQWGRLHQTCHWLH